MRLLSPAHGQVNGSSLYHIRRVACALGWSGSDAKLVNEFRLDRLRIVEPIAADEEVGAWNRGAV